LDQRGRTGVSLRSFLRSWGTPLLTGTVQGRKGRSTQMLKEGGRRKKQKLLDRNGAVLEINGKQKSNKAEGRRGVRDKSFSKRPPRIRRQREKRRNAVGRRIFVATTRSSQSSGTMRGETSPKDGPMSPQNPEHAGIATVGGLQSEKTARPLGGVG